MLKKRNKKEVVVKAKKLQIWQKAQTYRVNK
jgi:hypothetical protein